MKLAYEVTDETNPLCPDHSSHFENATERAHPDWYTKGYDRNLTPEQWAEIDAEADLEYQQCEGHD
jgi:hypothetical protein